MRTALAMAGDEFDWDAAEAEMAEFLADEKDPALRPEVLQELAEAGWFDQASPSWEGALCASHPDPDLWHPQGLSSAGKFATQQRAIAICQPCPIRMKCRKYGLQNMKEGVWGGVALDPARDPSTPDPRSLVTHCKRGHSEWRSRGRGRLCLQCERDRTARHRAKKKEQRDAAA